jgi:hypothetical protein
MAHLLRLGTEDGDDDGVDNGESSGSISSQSLSDANIDEYAVQDAETDEGGHCFNVPQCP